MLEASVHALHVYTHSLQTTTKKILGRHFATTLLKRCENISAVFKHKSIWKAICKISCQSSKVHQAKSLQVPLVHDSVYIFIAVGSIVIPRTYFGLSFWRPDSFS